MLFYQLALVLVRCTDALAAQRTFALYFVSLTILLFHMLPALPTLYFNNILGRVHQHGADYVRVVWQKALMTHTELRADRRSILIPPFF